MTAVTIRSIACAAPGFEDWQTARAVLAGETPYQPAELGKLKPAWLPANERRRLSPVMRLALHVGEQALEASDCSPDKPASVFASSSGDGDIIHGICEELDSPEPELSPTKFHNSVHNAPAGYWAIASGAHAPASAVAAYDATFAAGWIEAALLAADTGAPVLLVAYDRPYPAPLDVKRHLAAPFACALLLDADPNVAGVARIAMETNANAAATTLDDAELEALRGGNPAARALPLFRLLARKEAGAVALPWIPNSTLTLNVTI
ncbi:MAG: beta-ketoacyl synthase chain length factor [Gammaproteobacteria bacterium]|nr:beta-ketoacyl synthase chain length factor [Gammaproteobacteria bacterium]